MTTFPTKFLHNVSKPVLKGLCKFQVDITINARVTAVPRLENLYTSGSLDRRKKNTHWSIFPYNIIENSQISLVHNSVFTVPSTFKFGTETCCML